MVLLVFIIIIIIIASSVLLRVVDDDNEMSQVRRQKTIFNKGEKIFAELFIYLHALFAKLSVRLNNYFCVVLSKH